VDYIDCPGERTSRMVVEEYLIEQLGEARVSSMTLPSNMTMETAREFVGWYKTHASLLR